MRRFALSTLAIAALAVASVPAPAGAGTVITTTDFQSVSLPTTGYINNAGAAGGFTLNGNFFNNGYSFDQNWNMEFWHGWAISNHTDKTDGAWTNQYSAITGSGAGGSSQYAVVFDGGSFGGAYVNLAAGQRAYSMDVTNTTYAYFTMKNGAYPAHPFGDDDYFKLTINGYSGLDGTGGLLGAVVVSLADGKDILNAWMNVDLTGLGDSQSLSFTFSSSDNDPVFGMNTPAFVAVDNFRTFADDPDPAAVPEPASLALLGAGLLGVVGLARRSRR